MRVKDKISDIYREQVNKALGNQYDTDLFNLLNQEEMDEIWEEISTEMDIDNVWYKISSYLDIVMPTDSSSSIIVKAIAIIIIILIGMVPVRKTIFNSDTSQLDIITETKQNEQSAELVITIKTGDSYVKGDKSGELTGSSDNGGYGNELIQPVSNRTSSLKGIPIQASGEVFSKVLDIAEITDSNLVGSLGMNTTENFSIPPLFISDDLKMKILFSRTDSDSLKFIDNFSIDNTSLPYFDRAKFSGGIITSFRNSWLLNYETMDGFKSDTYTSTEIVFFPDVGLSLNYSLNNSWFLQVDGLLSSNSGQEYLGYYHGHYARKKITLNYSTINLSVKYKFLNSSNLQPTFSINVLAGGYISILRGAYQKINSDLESIGSQYRKFDYGVRLGGEFELHIFDQLSLAPGLFLSLGIPNIYKGNFRRTHIGNAVFNLTFYLH